MTYTYRVVEVEKVTDGDTFWLHLDVGFRQRMLTHIRLAGYDTPELRRGSDYEKERARHARTMVESWFSDNSEKPILVRTEKDPDNFGRWLGTVWCVEWDGSLYFLHDMLEEFDLAVEWPSRWREVYDAEG